MWRKQKRSDLYSSSWVVLIVRKTGLIFVGREKFPVKVSESKEQKRTHAGKHEKTKQKCTHTCTKTHKPWLQIRQVTRVWQRVVARTLHDTWGCGNQPPILYY